MRSAWVIIVIVIALSQVVGAIMQKANKRKEQERLAELAQARREAESRQMGRRAAPTPAGATGTAPPAGSQGGGRAGLAARRQAQLDELRRRRQAQLAQLQAKRQGGKPVTARPTPTISRAPLPSAQTAPATQRIAPTRPTTGQRARPTSQPAGRPLGSAISGRKRRTLTPTLHDPSEVGTLAKAGPGAEVTHHFHTDPVGVMTATTRQRGHRGCSPRKLGLGDRAAMRRAFVLKEVLDPPIALRF